MSHSSDTSSPLDAVTWPVTGERISVRRARPEDAEPTWRYWSDPEVTRWLPAAPADLATHAARLAPPDRLPHLVVVELDGEVIGDGMLRISDAWAQDEARDVARHKEAELGWVLDPRAQGQGYGLEFARLLLRLAFDACGVHRVVASCFTANEPSWRLMERLRMRREQHAVADALHRELGWCDSYLYALTEDEWRSAW